MANFRTKKGNVYQPQDWQKNKLRRSCTGMRMVLADHPRGNSLYDSKVEIIRTLAVCGTLDPLGRIFGISKQSSKEHPTDKGYFKKVYVLSKIGRELSNKHKKKIKTI